MYTICVRNCYTIAQINVYGVQTIFRLSSLLSHPTILNCLWYFVYAKALLVATGFTCTHIHTLSNDWTHTAPTSNSIYNACEAYCFFSLQFVSSLWVSGYQYLVDTLYFVYTSNKIFRFQVSNYSHLHVNHINWLWNMNDSAI